MNCLVVENGNKCGYKVTDKEMCYKHLNHSLIAEPVKNNGKISFVCRFCGAVLNYDAYECKECNTTRLDEPEVYRPVINDEEHIIIINVKQHKKKEVDEEFIISIIVTLIFEFIFSCVIFFINGTIMLGSLYETILFYILIFCVVDLAIVAYAKLKFL